MGSPGFNPCAAGAGALGAGGEEKTAGCEGFEEWGVVQFPGCWEAGSSSRILDVRVHLLKEFSCLCPAQPHPSER